MTGDEAIIEVYIRLLSLDYFYVEVIVLWEMEILEKFYSYCNC